VHFGLGGRGHGFDGGEIQVLASGQIGGDPGDQRGKKENEQSRHAGYLTPAGARG